MSIIKNFSEGSKSSMPMAYTINIDTNDRGERTFSDLQANLRAGLDLLLRVHLKSSSSIKVYVNELPNKSAET